MPAQLSNVAAAVRRLGCSPAEAAALGILAAASVAAVALLWVIGRPAPAPAPGMVPGSGVVPTESASDTGGIVVGAAEVIVHVAGAVQRPGVYTLPGGSRVADAVAAAGDVRPRAVLDGLNLARPLTDGEQVFVPDRRAAAPPPAGAASPPVPGAAPAGAGASGGTVSLNAAGAAELETLPGIGPVLAQRIVQHRDSIGGFTEIGQLRDVSGIGEKTFQALVELVSL